MESIQVSLEVFLVGFAISLVMAALIKGLLAVIRHGEKHMEKVKAKSASEHHS